MRVGVMSYPMLFQRRGGLQIQILETLSALRQIGLDASLFDWRSEQLVGFDLIHVFSAINGNHRVVEAAVDAGVPVVVSSVLHPPFSRSQRRMAVALESLVGRLSGWSLRTNYRDTCLSLSAADRVVALGHRERDMLAEGYAVDSSKIEIVPNGVAQQFFEATPDLFRQKFQAQRPRVLNVAAINSRKNQAALVRSLAAEAVDVILIGPCGKTDEPYLNSCRPADSQKVHYLGAMNYDDPLLASAYAAADVFVLPSLSEVMPLSVMEALAAGTPVVVTKHHSLDIHPVRGIFEEVDPCSEEEIRRAVRSCLERRPHPEECRDLVRSYAWGAVAKMLGNIYQNVLADHKKDSRQGINADTSMK